MRTWAQLSAPLTEPPWLRWVDSGHWSFSLLLSESLFHYRLHFPLSTFWGCWVPSAQGRCPRCPRRSQGRGWTCGSWTCCRPPSCNEWTNQRPVIRSRDLSGPETSITLTPQARAWIGPSCSAPPAPPCHAETQLGYKKTLLWATVKMHSRNQRRHWTYYVL